MKIYWRAGEGHIYKPLKHCLCWVCCCCCVWWSSVMTVEISMGVAGLQPADCKCVDSFSHRDRKLSIQCWHTAKKQQKDENMILLLYLFYATLNVYLLRERCLLSATGERTFQDWILTAMYEFQILSANTPGVSDTWRSRERHWLDTGYLTIKSPEFKKTDISKTDNQRNQVQGSERKIRRVKMDFEGQSKKK